MMHSQEIRNNKITREEGIALVKKFDHEFPKKYFKDFLEYIDITESEFFKLIDKFRSSSPLAKDKKIVAFKKKNRGKKLKKK